MFFSGVINNYNHINRLALNDSSLYTEVIRSVYVDESKKLTIDSIVNDLSLFREFDETINWGFSSSQYFYMFTISNKSNVMKDYVVYMDNPMVDRISVYEINPGGYHSIAFFGDAVDLKSQMQYALPMFSFLLQPNQTKTFVVSTMTSGSAFLPTLFFERDDFTRYITAILLVWGAFIGIACVMTVYNLVLYTGTKDTLYLYYIGYVVFFALELGVMHGFTAFLVPDYLFQFLSKNINLLNAVISFFTLRFALKFLRFEESNSSRLSLPTKLFSYILLIFAISFVFMLESQAAAIFFILQLVTYVLVIGLMFTKVKSRLHWSKFYIISWLPLFTGAGIGSLLFIGVVEYEFWTRHAALIGVMLEMSLISLALAERLRISEQQRLFQASHHPVLGLANTYILVNCINSYYKNSKHNENLTLVFLDVEHYQSLASLLSESDFKNVVWEMLEDIKNILTIDLLLLEIESDSRFKNFATVREGTLSFLVLSNDTVLLKQALDSLTNYSPFHTKVGGESIELSYRIETSSLNEHNGDVRSIIKKTLRQLDSTKINFM